MASWLCVKIFQIPYVETWFAHTLKEYKVELESFNMLHLQAKVVA